MTIRELTIALGYEVDKSSEKKAESAINGFKSFASKALGVIGIGFSIAGIGQLAEAAADAEALNSQFAQVFGDMEAQAAESLNTISSDTGVFVNRMKGSFTQIASFAKVSGLEQADALDLASRAMTAVADSAAFYDRSIESVTESLQSYLKGNYENDAALGLSSTETTRNAAANELYGKSFQDLSEAQKQFTLLKMVEDANAASGALGQAARESDTWTNQLGNLKQALKDLKAAAGSGFLKPAVVVIKGLTGLVQGATKAATKLTDENSALNKKMEGIFALVKRMQPAAERFFNALINGASKAWDAANRIADNFGGMENVLRIVGVAAATLAGILAFRTAVIGIRKLITFAAPLSKLFSGTSLAVLKLAGIITLIVLLVDDFINFLQGNDSLMGTLFDKLGIGADNVRSVIFDSFERIKTFLSEHSEEIKGMFSATWGAVTNIVKAASVLIRAVLNLLLVGAQGIVQGFIFVWENWGTEITNIVNAVTSWLGAAFGFIISTITGVANFLSAIFSGDFAGAFEILKGLFINALSFIGTTLISILTIIGNILSIIFGIVSSVVSSIWTAITGFFAGAISGITGFIGSIVAGVSSAVSGIYNTIVQGITNAVNWIKSLPAQAVQWGADMINGFINGIKSAIGGIVDAVSGVAGKIKSLLHFSRPDEGPLRNYEEWMPDFIGGLAKGVKNSRGALLNEFKSLAGDMSLLVSSGTASAATAVGSTVSNRTSNVTQNVNISNRYSGGSDEAQKSVARGMKKSAVDATTQMARALAYARG